jgi:carbon-monoxide dehydrogenase large subunit
MGMGTYGSRSAAVGMTALSLALDKVVAKATKVAARCMEVAENTVEFTDGVFSGRGTNKTMTFGDVALQAYVAHKFDTAEIEPGLKETSFYDPKNFTFPAGVHIAEVEIDPDTGITTVERWTAVDDFGNVINPMIVEGQVHGGIAQGIGQAMLERTVYDNQGQLLTASYMDYCMPRADDMPSFDVALTNTPCPSNPLGVKGCGEAGAIAAPAALINAITDALGHENIAMPATAQAVWRAAQASRQSIAAE